MKDSRLLSEKELGAVCSGSLCRLVKESAADTLSIIGAIAGFYFSGKEIMKIEEDLKLSSEDWDNQKNVRIEEYGHIGDDIHSKIVRRGKKALANGYNKCHNGVVDFLRSH